MRFPPESLDDLQEYLSFEPEGINPLLYTLQIGRLFCSISILEQTTHGLLLTQADGDTIRKISDDLRKSTFGQMVNRLSTSGVDGRDLKYLRRINTLRNEVVHRLFFEFPFPGDPEIEQVELNLLLAPLERLQRHFRFAERNLSKILVQAGALSSVDLGAGGTILHSPEMEW